mgnify:CR=1 FL=1
MFTFSRKKLFFNQPWKMDVDPFDIFERHKFWEFTGKEERPSDVSPAYWHRINVPGCWNMQRKELEYYEGVAWYYNRFSFSRRPNVKYILYFEGANYRTKVWLNKNFIGENEGGFTPFYFDVTEQLENENVIIVKVDSTRIEDGVPTLIYDWFNFGGITRPVYIFPVATTFIKNYKVSTRIKGGKTVAKFEVWIDGKEPPDSATISMPDVKFTGIIPLKKGYGVSEFEINPVLWEPGSPQLYKVEIYAEGDRIQDLVGFREIRVEGDEILLNGKPVFLRGVCLHEEAEGKGRTLNMRDVVERLNTAKHLNCNFLRLTHYPHTELMARKADSMGIMLWEEIPVYWLIKFENSSVLSKAKYQMTQLIERDWNRASVIIWSVQNETHPDKARNKFLSSLVEHTRKLDNSRLVSSACILTTDKYGNPVIDDPLTAKYDVVGLNEYYGWYEKTPEDLLPFANQKSVNKPIIITETGADAVYSHHGPKTERFTEEYQADFHERQIKILDTMPRIRGICPWLLFDFRSPLRINRFQKGYNRKGLMDNHGRRKAAFKVYQRYYAEKSKAGK